MRRASLAALVLAVGCHDFTLVEPRPAGRASLEVVVQVSVRDSVTVDLFAGFRTGAGSVPPSALSVQGATIQPAVQNLGFWTYQWREVFPVTSAPSQLAVTTPNVGGSPSSALSLTIPIARRDDPLDVTVPFGDDLLLHVSPAPTPPPPLIADAVQWTVILEQAAAVKPGQVFLSGNGAYPPELKFPWEWVHALSPDSLRGRFQAIVRYQAPSAAYDLDVSTVSEFAWRVHIAPKVP